MPVPLAGEYFAGNALLAWLQFFQQMMNQAVDIVLGEREGIVAHPLFANGAINRMLVGLLDPVENDGPGAEADIFVAGIRRAVSPGFPAAKWPANQTRIRAAISHGDGGVAAIHRKFIVDQKICRRRIGYLLEPF